MLRKLKIWWTLLSQAGSITRLSRQIDTLVRYYVLHALADEGLFAYLGEPRTYGQILAEFDYVESDYIREVFDLLVNDKDRILIEENTRYRYNSDFNLPQMSTVMAGIDKRYQNIGLIAKGMIAYIPARLRNQTLDFSETFEQEGRQLLSFFDKALSNKIYGAARNAAFAGLTDEDRAWLPGKKLLDVGCGSGREVAEIWMHLKGDIQITGIDSVASMVEMAEQSFSTLIHEIDPMHPPLNEANKPEFKIASATNLPFDDDSFDAVFYSIMLHWTSDPQRAVQEMVRVVKPGGLLFGAQGGREAANPYMNILMRANENIYGAFWMEDYRHWYADLGLYPEITTPAGIFRVRKGNSRD